MRLCFVAWSRFVSHQNTHREISMLRKIKIIEKSSGNLLALYPVRMEFPDYFDEEYFDEAWMFAIYDGVVDPDKRSDYNIEFVGEAPPELVIV